MHNIPLEGGDHAQRTHTLIHTHTSRVVPGRGQHAKPIINNILLEECGMHSARIHTNIPLEKRCPAQLTHHTTRGGGYSKPIIHNILLEAIMHSSLIHSYTDTPRPGTVHTYTHTSQRRRPCTAHHTQHTSRGGDHAQRTHTHIHSYHSRRRKVFKAHYTQHTSRGGDHAQRMNTHIHSHTTRAGRHAKPIINKQILEEGTLHTTHHSTRHSELVHSCLSKRG
jgi:hypothetical protein